MSDNDDEGGRDIAGGEVIMPTTVTSESSKVTEVPTGMLKGMSIISSAAQETAKTMKATSDKFETVILHTDPTLEYGCPAAGEWLHSEVLTDEMTASYTTGAGCYVSYTFTGSGVVMYGATGPKAGVFGCSTASDLWKTVGWWSAYGSSSFFKPYQGSCSIRGLGYGSHTITMTNSPNDPKGMYFTGLRYYTNKSEETWIAPEWSACCGGYTFPEGATTTIEPSGKGSTALASGTSSAGSNGGGSSSDYDWKTILGISLAALLLVALTGLLVGCMCCRSRGKEPDVLTKLAEHAGKARRKRKPRSKRQYEPLSSSGGSSNDSTGDDGEEDSETDQDEKKPQRRRRGKS